MLTKSLKLCCIVVFLECYFPYLFQLLVIIYKAHLSLTLGHKIFLRFMVAKLLVFFLHRISQGFTLLLGQTDILIIKLEFCIHSVWQSKRILYNGLSHCLLLAIIHPIPQ